MWPSGKKVWRPCLAWKGRGLADTRNERSLFCHNVWPSCCVTVPQLCRNASWWWRNTPELMH